MQVKRGYREPLPSQLAPEGTVYVCSACGKRARDQYGVNMIDRGWDESCMLNSVLCYEGGPPWKVVTESSPDNWNKPEH